MGVGAVVLAVAAILVQALAPMDALVGALKGVVAVALVIAPVTAEVIVKLGVRAVALAIVLLAVWHLAIEVW